MKGYINFDNFIELVAMIISGLIQVKLPNPNGFERRMIRSVQILGGIYLAIGIIADNMILRLLYYLQHYRGYLIATLVVVAIIPGITAMAEQKRGDFSSSRGYPVANACFNLFGVLCAVALLGLASIMIDRLEYLAYFPIEGAISVLFPICVGYALLYQRIEAVGYKNGEVDHDTSYDSLNQRLNILHLISDCSRQEKSGVKR